MTDQDRLLLIKILDNQVTIMKALALIVPSPITLLAQADRTVSLVNSLQFQEMKL